MLFSCLSRSECLDKYNRAEDKRYAITVIAGLTAASEKEVRAFLGLDENYEQSCANRKACETTEERAVRFHQEGYCDVHIAKFLGVSKTWVERWREKEGLQANPKPEPTTLESEMARLYALGYNDYEIAAELHISRTPVRKWRTSNDLPAKGRIYYSAKKVSANG